MSPRTPWRVARASLCALVTLLLGAGLACTLEEPVPPRLSLFFTTTPNPGMPGSEILFDATGLGSSSSSSMIEVRWDWEGDGTWDTPFSTGKRTSHAYPTAGRKKVILEAGLVGGVQDTVQQWVDVREAYWTNEFAAAGLDDAVNALVVYHDRIVAGGGFHQSAAGSELRHVGVWDNGGWLPLGAGFDDEVMALAVYHDSLFAGGRFRRSGADSVNYVACWDGTAWQSRERGFNGPVYALLAAGTGLYAGGEFTKVRGRISGTSYTVNHLAMWSRTQWGAVGGGLDGPVMAMVEELAGGIYVGGCFNVVDLSSPQSQILARNIARYPLSSGGQWSVPGGGLGALGDTVRALALVDGALVAGGRLTGTELHGLATLNGGSWRALGGGVGRGAAGLGIVRALVISEGNLVVAGDFDLAGTTSAAGISIRQNETWVPLGDGLRDGAVRALAIAPQESGVIAGGSFLRAGGGQSRRIAWWWTGRE